jgi:hypothetical protein
VKTLAKIDVGNGREAAIVERDDGRTCWRPGVRWWLVANGKPSFVHVPRGTIVAGDLVPGSSRIEVRGAEPADTAVAGGCYLALLPGKHGPGHVFVLFRDERGEIVRREPGEVLKSTPLAANVPCPACGGAAWDKVEWRTEPDAPTPRVRAVVCRRCGHYDGAESIGRLRRPEPEPVEVPSPLPEDPSAAEIVAAARFPVYVPARPPIGAVSQVGWGSGDDGLVHIAFRGAQLWVDSFSDSSPYAPAERARMQVVRELMEGLRGTFDDDMDVHMLQRREARRRLEAAVEAAGSRSVSIVVSRRRREFALVEYDGYWAAAAEGVLVSGRDVAPEDVALRRLRPDDRLPNQMSS